MDPVTVWEDPEDNGGTIDARLLPNGDGSNVPGAPALENKENHSSAGPAQHSTLPAVQDQYNAQNRKRKLYRLSSLAKVYGVENIRLEWPERDGHTGMTPLPLLDTSGDQDRDNLLSYTKQMTQRNMTNGWTSSELRALNALTHYNVIPARLPNDPKWRPRTLHPLVEKSRWRTRGDLGAGEAFLPIGSGRGGHYNAANDDVWNLLLPRYVLSVTCLMLLKIRNDPKQYTTENANGLYITEEGTTPWNEPWRTTFWSKAGPVNAEDKKRIRRRLQHLARHIKLQINNCDVHPTQSRLLMNEESTHWGTLALTCPFVRPGSAQEGQKELQALVTINYKFLYHMLCGGLTEAEIEGTQALLAETILHELAHALWVAMTVDGEHPERHPESGEPFYENEPIRELGWSMTHHFFGTFQQMGSCPPLFASFTRNWPTLLDKDLGAKVKPEEKERIENKTSQLLNYSETFLYPIPRSYDSDMLSQGFWDRRDAQGGRYPHKLPTIYGRGEYGLYISCDGFVEKLDEVNFQVAKMASHHQGPAAELADFFKNRYQFSTNEYQRLKASLHAHHRGGMSRYFERYAKWRLDTLASDASKLYGIKDVKKWKETQRLAGPGNYTDFEWETEFGREKPENFGYILRAVLKLRKRCCFESMVKPRPAYLVLDYLNRAIQELRGEGEMEFHREIEYEEWFDFLEYVSIRSKLFALRDYRGLSHRNNAPRGNGVECMIYIPGGWEYGNLDVYPPAVDYMNWPLHLEDGQHVALRNFRTFMAVFSGYKDRKDGLKLNRWALGMAFLRSRHDFDIDAVTFNRGYNEYLKREHARLLKTARHKGSGPPALISMDLMLWAFGSGHIEGWTLGPFETLRFSAKRCVYEVTADEAIDYKMGGDVRENEERLEGDKYVEQVKQDERRKAEHKEFLEHSWEQLNRSLHRKEDLTDPDQQEQEVADFRETWDEMRMSGLPPSQRTPAQGSNNPELQAWPHNVTLAEQLGRKWTEKEDRRKAHRQALLERFRYLMQNHWYKERGSDGGKGTNDGVAALYALWERVEETIGDHVGEMTLGQQRQLAYDIQYHIVWLEDLERTLQGMSVMQMMGQWGWQLSDDIILPSKRRQELWSLQVSQEDEFRNSPQWFCTDEQKQMLWNRIVERQRTKPVMRNLAESEQARWEKEEAAKHQTAKRKREEEEEKTAHKRSKYNPPPYKPTRKGGFPFTSACEASEGAMPTRLDHIGRQGARKK